MKTEGKAKIARRDFLRVLGAGAGAAAAPVALVSEAQATESDQKKSKTRYQANSADIQAYYRVNSYPKK